MTPAGNTLQQQLVLVAVGRVLISVCLNTTSENTTSILYFVRKTISAQIEGSNSSFVEPVALELHVGGDIV